MLLFYSILYALDNVYLDKFFYKIYNLNYVHLFFVLFNANSEIGFISPHT